MAKPFPLSNTLTEIVQTVAKQRNTTPEAIQEEWLYHFLYETPINLLNDEQVLALADFMLSEEQEEKLGYLLESQRENQLDETEKKDLETFMKFYGHLQTRKAQAMAEAVQRALRPQNLDEWPQQA